MSEAKNGSPVFYALLERMSNIHNQKSHDYASNSNPYGNYHFAGKMSKLFDNPDDAGFVGRIAEKLFRLANLENGRKTPSNESIEDTEIDICVISALWMASRMERRASERITTHDSEEKYICAHCNIHRTGRFFTDKRHGYKKFCCLSCLDFDVTSS